MGIAQLRVKNLRFILSQLPASEDDRDLAVFMPYYQRTFPLVAFDDLKHIEGEEATEDSPLILITGPRPQ